MLIIVLYFVPRLTYVVLSLLVRIEMDPRCPPCFCLIIGSTYQYVPRDSFVGKESPLTITKAHMAKGTS